MAEYAPLYLSFKPTIGGNFGSTLVTTSDLLQPIRKPYYFHCKYSGKSRGILVMYIGVTVLASNTLLRILTRN